MDLVDVPSDVLSTECHSASRSREERSKDSMDSTTALTGSYIFMHMQVEDPA